MNTTFKDHLESIYGSVERALDRCPGIRLPDVKNGERPNAVIGADGNLFFIDANGKLFRPGF